MANDTVLKIIVKYMWSESSGMKVTLDQMIQGLVV